jgi:hypothetical protein
LFGLGCASYVNEFNKHFANVANLKYQNKLRLATPIKPLFVSAAQLSTNLTN